MKVFKKLVRDKIPEIITKNGDNPVTRILGSQEYEKELDIKLREELEEYMADKNIEELADLVEVVYAILDLKGMKREEFEIIRKGKVEKRGAFNDKIFLESTD